MNRLLSIMVLMVFMTTPLESVEVLSGISIVKLVSIVLILVTIGARKKIFVKWDPFSFILLIYTILTILSYLWSIDKEITLQKSLFTMFPSFIVTLIIFHSINEREDLDKVFLAYVIGCLIIAGVSMYVYFTGYNIIDDDEGRVTALNQDQNELSFLLSFGVISIIYLLKYLRLKKATKVSLFMVAALFAFVILTTGSRMGLILLIMIVGTLIVMNIKSASVFYIIPLICVLGIAFFELIPDTTAERLIQINDQISNRDLTGRVTIWKLGLIAFESKKAYLLGTGYYTFQSLVGAKSGQYMASHNTYLSTLIELGAVGFLIFLSLIIYLIYRAWYLIRNCSFFFILLILPLLATMFVLTTNNRRWLFLIGVIIIKLWYFAREEINISLPQPIKGNISKT